MKLITLLAVFACACGGKKSDGNPAMVKEAQDLAKRVCECNDDACADKVKTAGGDATYKYFVGRTDTSSMNNAELGEWGEARDRWNECMRPGYFKKKK